MRRKHKTIYTDRFILRRPYLLDVDDLFEATNNPKVCRYEGWKRHEDRIETLNFVNSMIMMYDEKMCFDYIIQKKDDEKVIGVVNIHDIDFGKRTGYIGYWLAERYWDKGYGSEIVEAFVEHCFDFIKIKTIYGLCHPDNTASIKILIKSGFVYDGERESDVFKNRTDETKCDSVLVFKKTRKNKNNSVNRKKLNKIE